MKKPLLALALTLSALGGFAPLGFCAPKEKPTEPTSKIEKEKRPKKSSEDGYKKIVINKEIFLPTSLPKNRKGNYLLAPETQILAICALANNPNLEVVELPKIKYIHKYAFSECKNLKKIILGDDLKEVFPSAFIKCNPDLKLVYKGKEYSPLEFFRYIDQPIVFKNPKEELHTQLKKLSSTTNDSAKKPQITPNLSTQRFISVPMPLGMASFPAFPLVNSSTNKIRFFPTFSYNVVPSQQLLFKPVNTNPIKNPFPKEPSVIESSIDE